MSDNNIDITIFTPAYNRAHTLSRTYNSLINQSCKDFIWLIIDDGSTDDTQALVEEWQSRDNGFAIEYIYKNNGGLHTAYNEAIANIDTELCVCVDSDDWMPIDAIDRILRFWKENGSDDVAGIIGLDSYSDNRIIGDKLPNQKKVNLIDLLKGKYKLKNGDRTNVVRTELYKRYAPMKVFEGEKNFNPHYMHLQISRSYDFLVLNDTLKYVEYQRFGMSDQIYKQYKNSPNSFMETRLLYLSFDSLPFKFIFKHSIHLISSAIMANRFIDGFKKTPHKLLYVLAIPFGIALFIYINLKARK